jgi:hypothetical protein
LAVVGFAKTALPYTLKRSMNPDNTSRLKLKKRERRVRKHRGIAGIAIASLTISLKSCDDEVTLIVTFPPPLQYYEAARVSTVYRSVKEASLFNPW